MPTAKKKAPAPRKKAAPRAAIEKSPLVCDLEATAARYDFSKNPAELGHFMRTVAEYIHSKGG